MGTDARLFKVAVGTVEVEPHQSASILWGAAAWNAMVPRICILSAFRHWET